MFAETRRFGQGCGPRDMRNESYIKLIRPASRQATSCPPVTFRGKHCAALAVMFQVPGDVITAGL